MNTTQAKIGLSVLEAGWLLQRPEGRIRGMLRRGELTYVVGGRKIDPSGVRERLDGAYAHLLLGAVLGGAFEVPKPEHRGCPPAALYPGTLGLLIQTGIFLPDEEIKPLLDELADTHRPDLLE